LIEAGLTREVAQKYLRLLRVIYTHPNLALGCLFSFFFLKTVETVADVAFYQASILLTGHLLKIE